MKNQDFPNFMSKNKCIVTGQTKTTAIQIDLSNGKILQKVGAEFSSFEGYKHKASGEKEFNSKTNKSSSENFPNNNSQDEDPLWLVLKNYDYLSFDHENGMTQWSIFYTEIQHKKEQAQHSNQIMNSYIDPIQGSSIFSRGNILYTLELNENNQPLQKWSFVADAPIFQVLTVNKDTDEVREVPLNQYVEKEKNNIKLVFIDNFIYADHSFQFLPDLQLGDKSSDSAVKRLDKYEEWRVPVKSDQTTVEDLKMLEGKKDQDQQQKDQITNQTQQLLLTTDSANQSLLSSLFRTDFILLIITVIAIQYIFRQNNPKKTKKDKKNITKSEDQNSNEKQSDLQEQQKQEKENQVQEVQPVKRKIQIIDQNVLGLGSGGTVVFEGTLNERLVAVKRMLVQHNKLAMKEIKFLQKVDLHPNLITYFDHEEDNHFVYLAIEKCEGNLENLVELIKAIKNPQQDNKWELIPLASVYIQNPDELLQPTTILQYLQQSLKGLKFLHDNNIVHRDIKPHNILINKLKTIKLSDMGLSKQLHEDQISYHTEIKGSLGWQPPEVIHSEKEHQPLKTSLSKTQKVDIFSLGCVFFYILSLGEHPFGKRFEREKNILKGNYNLNGVIQDIVQERTKEAQNLVEQMIQQDPKKRPTAQQLLMHIFFWTNDKKLKLIQDLSDKLEFQTDKNGDLIMKLETIGAKYQVLRSCNNNWTSVLHSSLVILLILTENLDARTSEVEKIQLSILL